ncbi:MAG: rsxB 4 [Firmicutes bacterium]|nr:rsxB 4 [Bacillota bacterium]
MKLITTQKVNCQDCHRCLRSCPVKAIGIEAGQARVLENKCVLCGRCVVECPQQAKVVEDEVEFIKQAILSGRQVVLSLAPSFVAAFNEYRPDDFFAILAGLGFSAVEETAVGAELISRVYASMMANSKVPVISACCPVVVRIIKKYYPGLTHYLAPVVSPMLAHAQLIKRRFGQNAMVVFAGPCIGKIAEKDEANSAVDAVITFAKLRKWLTEANNPIGSEVQKENLLPASSGARFYPIAGGILKSFTKSEYTDSDVISVDGLEECVEAFAALMAGDISPRFVEALACRGGCINGPVSGRTNCSPAKRMSIIQFAACGASSALTEYIDEADFARKHVADQVSEFQPQESEIRQVLYQTGKYFQADEKNCGACGFNSCREKAIAVCQGLTSVETCVPYMRTKAESFANIIVDNSLNGIIVVDKNLAIQEFNPAAERIFKLHKENVKNRALAEFMDSSDVALAAQTGRKVINRRVELVADEIIVSQMIIPVVEHGLIIIVMTDISGLEKNSRELEQVKRQTVEKATEIINKQMQVAQEIAGLLGETTAETKAALFELIGLVKPKEDN